MTMPFLFHPQSEDGLSFDGTHLTVTLHIEPIQDISKVVLRHEPDNEQFFVEMSQLEDKGRLQTWQARFPINQDRDVTHYVFKVQTTTAQYWLDARGVTNRIPPKEYHFKFNAEHRPAEWYKARFSIRSSLTVSAMAIQRLACALVNTPLRMVRCRR